MSAQLGRIILYTKKLEEVAEFYCTHFGFHERRLDGDRIVELVPRAGGAHIMLHPMGEGRKEGQTLVKLVFDGQNNHVGYLRVSAKRMRFRGNKIEQRAEDGLTEFLVGTDIEAAIAIPLGGADSRGLRIR